MKRTILAAAVFAAAVPAFAADFGSIPLNVSSSWFVTGQYTDTAEFTTSAAGPATVQVSGSARYYSGSGRGGRSGNAYNEVSSVTVTDSSNNAVCASVATLTAAPVTGMPFYVFTCQAASLPAGTYTVTVTGNAYQSSFVRYPSLPPAPQSVSLYPLPLSILVTGV
jgi:hypothetical protein